MIHKKNTSRFQVALLTIFALTTCTQKIHTVDTKKITGTMIASAITILSVNELWGWLSARSGSGDIKKRAEKADAARVIVNELLPKWKNGSITHEEYKQLKTAIWHIIDADWIGYYKTPKNRISIDFKTTDGRAVVIDAMEKSNGSVGLGKVFQRIQGLSDFKKLIAPTIAFGCGVMALNHYLETGSLEGLFEFDGKAKSWLKAWLGIE